MGGAVLICPGQQECDAAGPRRGTSSTGFGESPLDYIVSSLIAVARTRGAKSRCRDGCRIPRGVNRRRAYTAEHSKIRYRGPVGYAHPFVDRVIRAQESPARYVGESAAA